MRTEPDKVEVDDPGRESPGLSAHALEAARRGEGGEEGVPGVPVVPEKASPRCFWGPGKGVPGTKRP